MSKEPGIFVRAHPDGAEGFVHIQHGLGLVTITILGLGQMRQLVLDPASTLEFSARLADHAYEAGLGGARPEQNGLAHGGPV
jgi:hypothetical protein